MKKTIIAPKLSIIDFIIILLLDATLIIFVFWIASTLIGESAFNTLPAWITNITTNIWTWFSTTISAITFIGIKSFTDRQNIPNYFHYSTISTLFIFLFILIALLLFFFSKNYFPPKILKKSFFITNENGGTDWAYKYSLTGNYWFSDGHLLGEITEGSLKASDRQKESRLTYIQMSLCYFSVPGTTSWITYPERFDALPSQNVFVAQTINPNEEIKISSVHDKKFNIPVSSGILAKNPWICSGAKSEAKFNENIVETTVYAHSSNYKPIETKF